MDQIKKAVDDFLFCCRYEKNLTDKTLKAYLIDLTQFLAFIESLDGVRSPEEIDKEVMRAYLKIVLERAKPKTAKRKMATLRAWLHFLEMEDRILVSPFRKMRINLSREKKLPVVMTLAEVSRLFTYLYREKQMPWGRTTLGQKALIRDIAVIELLFATGMRVSELCSLRRSDLELVKGTVKIYGKGRRERWVPLCEPKVIRALKSYFKAYDKDLPNQDFVFLNRRGARLSEQTVRIAVEKHVLAAGIDKKVTPHTFRHTIATLLLENGVDIRYIQNLLGHSTIHTTEIYAKVSKEAQRKILKKAHPRKALPGF